jgi:hypothetical protein
MIVACAFDGGASSVGSSLEAGLRVMAADRLQAQGDRTDLGPDRQPQQQAHESSSPPAARARACNTCYPDGALGGTAIVLTTEIRDVRLDDVLASAPSRRATVDISQEFAAVRHGVPLLILLPADLAAIGGRICYHFHHVGPVSGPISSHARASTRVRFFFGSDLAMGRQYRLAFSFHCGGWQLSQRASAR